MKTKNSPQSEKNCSQRNHRGSQIDGPIEDQWLSEELAGETDAELLDLVKGLRNLPELEPPAVLLPNVMNAVRAHRIRWWQRLYRWTRAPHSITFTPLRLAPVMMLLIVCGVLWSLSPFKTETTPPLQARNEVKTGRVPVVFTLNLPGARSVAVIGSFNQWDAQGGEMRFDSAQKRWILQVELPRGRYEYAFLVDGQKVVTDPGALLLQDDGFGSQNAILMVGNNHENNI